LSISGHVARDARSISDVSLGVKGNCLATSLVAMIDRDASSWPPRNGRERNARERTRVCKFVPRLVNVTAISRAATIS